MTVNIYDYEVVGIKNTDLTIQHLCQGAQAWMYPRELYVNAQESSERYILDKSPTVPVKIYIGALSVNDLLVDESGNELAFTKPKLRVLNLGGMTADELYEATKMSSSVNKTQSEDDNFGIGMKITITKWSDILYITRKNSKSHMCVLGMRNNQLVRIVPVTACNKWVDAQNIARGYFEVEDHDFTEIILLGKNWRDDNTLVQPYEGAPNTHTFFLNQLYKRIVNIPNNIDVVSQQGSNGYATKLGDKRDTAHSTDDNFYFKPFDFCFDKMKNENKECLHESPITLDDGTKIHFYYNAPHGDKGNPASWGSSHAINGRTFSAIIWGKDGHQEYFDVAEGNRWRGLASRLGVISGFQHFSVFVELPFHLYKMGWSRDHVVKKGDNDAKKIEFENYIDQIRSVLPDAIKEKISEHNSAAERNTSLDDILRKKLEEYRDLLLSGKSTMAGNGSLSGTGASVIAPRKPKDGITPIPVIPKISKTIPDVIKKVKPALNSKYREDFDLEASVFADIPEVTVLWEEAQINELEMQNTFARFTSGGGTNGRDRIDVNPHHNVVDYLLSKVEFNHETIGHLARRQALKLLEIKIALSVIMAKSDWKNPDTQFTKEDFDAMVKDSVLTLQARQCIDQLKELRDSIDDLEKQARAGLLPEEDPILSAKQQKWQEAGVRMPVFWEE
jgi:hypothetical protein